MSVVPKLTTGAALSKMFTLTVKPRVTKEQQNEFIRHAILLSKQLNAPPKLLIAALYVNSASHTQPYTRSARSYSCASSSLLAPLFHSAPSLRSLTLHALPPRSPSTLSLCSHPPLPRSHFLSRHAAATRHVGTSASSSSRTTTN